jgi:hypothetical protein
MILVTSFNQFNDFYIYFCDSIKNTVMVDGIYTRILYSSPSVVLNGIYISFTFKDVECEKYYNKFKLNFDTIKNESSINSIKNIEELILKKYNSTKTPQFKLCDQLNCGNIKLFNSFNTKQLTMLLKISGIWENANNYGLTFKFYPSVV